VLVGLGGVFGTIEVAMVAFTEEHGHAVLAGPLLALHAISSALTGVAYGARAWRMPLHRRLQVAVALLFLGTVPLALAQWDQARTWYAHESHGAMTNNDTVLAAVVDLLNSDATQHLTMQAPALTGERVRVTTDRELRAQATRKVQWDALSLDSRRRILEPVISPEFA